MLEPTRYSCLIVLKHPTRNSERAKRLNLGLQDFSKKILRIKISKISKFKLFDLHQPFWGNFFRFFGGIYNFLTWNIINPFEKKRDTTNLQPLDWFECRGSKVENYLKMTQLLLSQSLETTKSTVKLNTLRDYQSKLECLLMSNNPIINISSFHSHLIFMKIKMLIIIF